MTIISCLRRSKRVNLQQKRRTGVVQVCWAASASTRRRLKSFLFYGRSAFCCSVGLMMGVWVLLSVVVERQREKSKVGVQSAGGRQRSQNQTPVSHPTSTCTSLSVLLLLCSSQPPHQAHIPVKRGDKQLTLSANCEFKPNSNCQF